MIIKKFQSATEKDAILLAKEELGNDAIVMNIKTIKPKGIYKLFSKPTVEVTATVDEDVSYDGEKLLEKMQAMKNMEKNFGTKRIPENTKDIIFDEELISERAPQTSAIEDKLNNLQNLLVQQLGNKSFEEKRAEGTEDRTDDGNVKNNACIKLIYDKLIENEVDEKYAAQIINEIKGSINKETSVDNILASIYQKIILKLGQIKGIEVEENKTKFIYFIGPTGVGKTTTIAKIASYYKLNKKAKVAMITSDTYRIAAVDQLRTYANILEMPLKVVYSGDEITEARELYADFNLVLVDTAGHSHHNAEQRDDVEKLVNSIPEEYREVYLVISATTKYNDLKKITETYSKVLNYKLIFTKLDETSNIGNMLNIRMLTGAPLSYTTWGQNVPDDIGRIDAQKVAKQLLGGKD